MTGTQLSYVSGPSIWEERHGVMYTGDGKEKSGNQKAMPGKGLSN